MTAGVIAQVRFVELFFENSGVNDDQSGEFGNYSRLRDVAESVTDENSPGNVHMEMVSPGQLRCPLCGLKIKHLSEIFVFIKLN